MLAISFANSQTGYAVGDQGTVLKTEDAGLTWTLQILDPNNLLTGVDFVSSDIGFIAGSEGMVLATQNGGNVNVQHGPLSNEFVVYPNPVKDDFKINLGAIGNNNMVEVYDLYGRCVLQRMFDSKSPTIISTDGWGKGVYLVRVLENETPFFSQRVVIQ